MCLIFLQVNRKNERKIQKTNGAKSIVVTIVIKTRFPLALNRLQEEHE